MGAGSSKPEQHVFNADAPVSLSQSVLDSLQRNPESDSTRARHEDLKVQTRVNAELARIRDAQAQKLSDLTASLTTNPPTSKPAPAEQAHDPNSLAAHLSSPFYQDHTPKAPSSSAGTKEDSGRSHDSVAMEIAELKRKLEGRRKVEKVPAAVEGAKEELVRCLRGKEGRALDCWREVEVFKNEVGKLERKFVEQVGR